MELMFVKWIAAITLFLVTLFFTVLPLILFLKVRRIQDHHQHARCSKIISLLSCAGGGVFLGTCLLHLFPDVQEQMALVFRELQMKQTFPVAEFLLGFGFLVMLSIEQMVLAYHSSHDIEQTSILTHQHSHHSHSPLVHENAAVHVYPDYGSVTPDPEESIVHSDHEERSHSIHEDLSSHSPLRYLALVLALSLHSVFEGLAIGLEATTEGVIRLLVAVFIHKSVIAFTLGLNLVNSNFGKKTTFWSIGIFSGMSPLGTVMGSIILGLTKGLGLALSSGILQGISAGTFVYVTFFEILPHEMNSMDNKLWKVLFLTLGFSGISLLVLYLPS